MRAIGEFRGALAQVLNHDAAMVCPQPSVTAAAAQALYSLPARPGRNRLLLAERAFPSLGFLFSAAERRGFEVLLVPRHEDTQDPDVWARYLDERVHCVLFTHVHSNSGECHDIASLAELARRWGAVSIVDVAQSIGVRATDAATWNADFIIGSCLKWLCGGSGAGFLWVHPERVEDCRPVEVGWFSHADPFEFDIHHFEYAEDALRFWGGTPSVAPAVIAAHSIGALRDLGLERIVAHNRALTTRLVEGVSPHCLVSPADPEQRGGSVVVHAGAGQRSFGERLRAAGIKFDERREGIRLSPHFYNTTADIDAVLECLPAGAR